jgi:hypothetical protein
MLHGRCHCGAVQFETPEEPVHSAVCYCNDCRKQSGAPLVAWAMFPAATVIVQGEPVVYQSSQHGQRSFCGQCGCGLFFTNEPLRAMGMKQVRIATLDDPGAIAPSVQVQTAERVTWVETIPDLPSFDRFPNG